MAQLAEQLICNQQVIGSSPIIGFYTISYCIYGQIPEWPKGTDCKSAGTAFEGSNPSLPTTFHFMARSFRERVFYCFIIPMIPGKERGSGVLRAGCTKCFFLPDAGGETVL